jgi:penicillin-binding protein 1A
MPAGSTMRMWTPQQGEQPTLPATRAGRPGRGTKPPKPGKPSKGPRAPRPLWLTILKWGVIAGFLGVVLMVGTVAFVFRMYGRDPNLPDYGKLSDYQPRQVTWILDANGHRIGELFGNTGTTERRTYVAYEKVPPIVVDAFVAAEDNKFWTHSGVDYWGMFRAFIANLRAGKTKQGASTITQQVVKRLLLTPERTFKRKIQEIILARRLETALSKEEIMTLYMNEIYFGEGNYGIQEAARYYFGKDVSQLDVGEQRAKDRQTYVLNQLVAMGKLKPAEAQKWIDAPIQVIKQPFPDLGSAPEWVTLVRRELVAPKCGGKDTCPEGEAYLDKLGATVRTTLDPSLQANAQKALQDGLRKVDVRQHIGHPKKTVKKIDEEIGRLAKALPKAGPAKGQSYDAVVTAIHDDDQEIEVDLGGWKGSLLLGGDEDTRFNPDGKQPSERFKPGDVVPVVAVLDAKKADRTPKHTQHRVVFPAAPEGAVVIIDIKTRKVRALVGGYASKIAGFNRATMAHRQPGSSFKPFVYATGIKAGKDGLRDEGGRIVFTPASEVNDSPERIEKWLAKNYETGRYEGPVLLRYALSKSINTVSIKITERVKPESVASLAYQMGIHSQLPQTPAIALGAGEVTPLEMTNAVATLAAGGIAADPKFVDAINGKATAAAGGEQVIDPAVAYVTVDMMTSVVKSGTGFKAASLGIPIAGKTGTSNDARDVWFIGLTPDYAIGVWIGFDDPRPMAGETGGNTAVPVYVDIAKTMNLPAKQFVRPAHVVDARIDRKTGLLAPDGAPKETTMTEVFVEGTAPTEYAAKPGDVTDANQTESEYD